MCYLRLVLLGLLALVAFLLVPRAPASAATFSVNSTADAVDAGPGDGTCATAGGACTLRAAVQETNALPGPDTVSLPAGVYTLTIPGPEEDAAATGDLDITDDLTISGAGADVTVIDGGDLDRVLQTAGPLQVDISNVAVANGSTASFFPDEGFGSGVGGGIFNGSGVTLALTDVIVAGNWASHGGGGILNGGTLTVTSSSVSDNTGGVSGEGGGGGGIGNAGTATLIDSVVSGNFSGHSGGGVYNGGTLAIIGSDISDNTVILFTGGGIFNSGVLTIADSTVSENTAEERGGGIFNLGSVAVANSSISNNEASVFDGGGIANDSGSLTLTGVTVSGNKAGAGGGGIANGSSGNASPVVASTLTATNVTVSGNQAGGSGGGIYNGGGLNSASVSITNGTVTGNRAGASGGAIFNNPGYAATLGNTVVASGLGSDNCFGAITSGGHNLEDADTCGFTAPGDLIDSDPLLGPLADNGGDTATHALLAGSPAVDAGDGGECPETDQRGVARPIDGNRDGAAVCDIGAYEASEGTSPSPTPAPTPTPIPSATPTPAALPRSGGAPPAAGGGNGVPGAAAAGALGMAAAGVMVVIRIRIQRDRRGGEQRE